MCGQDRCTILKGSDAWSRAPQVRVRGVGRAFLYVHEMHVERHDFGRGDADRVSMQVALSEFDRTYDAHIRDALFILLSI